MAENGNNAFLTLNTKLMNQGVSSDFGIKTGMIETTSKTSAGFKEVIAGLKEFSLSLECIFDKKPSGTPTQVYAADIVGWQIAGTELDWTWQASQVTGDIKYSGKCYISDTSFKGMHDDKVTYSVTIQITGAATIGTV